MKDHYYKVLTFYLGNCLYAMPMPQLLEVIRPVKLFPVNKSEIYVLGMINYHGTAVPVLDLGHLLSAGPTGRSREQTWLAVKTDPFKICLSVDRVGRFRRISRENIDPVPDLIRNRETGCIKHYFRLQQDLVPVIDAQTLLAHKNGEIDALISGADLSPQGIPDP